MNTWTVQRRLFKSVENTTKAPVAWEVSLPTTASLYGPPMEQRLVIDMMRGYTSNLAPTPARPPRYGFQSWGRTMLALPASRGEVALPAGADFMKDYLDLVFKDGTPELDRVINLWMEFYPQDFVTDQWGDLVFRDGAFGEMELAA